MLASHFRAKAQKSAEAVATAELVSSESQARGFDFADIYSGAIVTLQAPASQVASAWPHPSSVHAVPSQPAGLC